MAFPQLRIGLKVAEHIMPGVEFEPVTIGPKTVGYVARFKGRELQDHALVHLCRKVWQEVALN